MSYNWSSKTVLIAEDEQTNYLFLEAALDPTRMRIIHAKNGREALDMYKANPDIDLVLMDIKMPMMNGFLATREIKSLSPETPVIAQTAYAMDYDREEIIRAGCDDYITQPIQIDILLEKIAVFLNKD